MEGKKAPRSLRLVTLGTVGVSFICFILVFMLIFVGNMSRLLKQAEDEHLAEIKTAVVGALKATLENLRANTRTWSSWDEPYNYILGENPEFANDNLGDGTMLTLYNIDYVIIKDVNGDSIYSGVRSEDENGARGEIPEGIDERVREISAGVLANQTEAPEFYTYEGPYSDTGFILNDGISYIICTMPVLKSDNSGPAVGTFTFIVEYNDAQFKNLTEIRDAKFSIVEQDPENPLTGSVVEILDRKTIKMRTVLENLGSDRSVILEFQTPRHLYLNSLSLIIMTTVALFCALMLILMLLFMFLDRYLLRPIGRLSSDVAKIGQKMSIDTHEYEQYQELQTLSGAINDTLLRLDLSYKVAEQSKISQNVLTNILDGLDAYLYVSNPENDEILFINDLMKKHFMIEGDGIGEVCWKVLQSGFSQRCDFCPCYTLENNPDEPVVWEEHNTVTNRYYRNTDILIDWIGDQKGHLQHSVDITDIKLAEIALQKRFQQQGLMTDISQNFLGNEDMDVQINRALKMIGEFMGASHTILNCYHANPHGYTCVNEWLSPESNGKPRLGVSFDLDEIEYPVIEKLMNRSISYVNSNEIKDNIAKHFDKIESFLVTPIFVDETFWGVLYVGRLSGEENWSESDISLCELVTSVISGVLTRHSIEAQLVRLSSIVQNSPQFITSITSDGKLFYVNPAVLTATGYTEDELIGGGLRLIYDEDTMRRIHEEYIPDTLKNGENSFETVLIRKDGEKRSMLFSSFVMDTKTCNIGAIARDITDIRKLEAELIAAKELAEQGSRSKGEFLSRMSHEMRTPMNAIIGMTNIAKSSDDPNKKEYCLEKIDGASRHLLGVINDILDMSKIEADKFELSCSDFIFDSMIMNVINVINFRMEEKSLKFSLYVDPAMPASIISDEQRIAQVITNLLTNAVKFTPENGNIGLNIYVENANADDSDEISVRVEVKDDGIGISAEQQVKLFRSFEQADGSIARKYGGTGLGLAISKRIVELMDGELWVESELGKGSTFIFTLKAKKAGENTLDSLKTKISRTDLTVLAVDDSVETCEYFQHIMREFDIACEVAYSGAQALEKIKAATKPFDILFVDWQMPGMNGIDLTRELRSYEDNNYIIIMISVAEWSEIEKEAVNAGVDGFLPKPLFPSLIIDCINKYVSDSDEQPDSDKTQLHNFAGKTALLAEDIDINREIVITILEGTGLEIDCAENGIEAVNKFSENPDRYDIVLMDVHMPEVDGLEATRRIRALDFEKAKHVPIVAMTANVFREDIVRCLKAGMDDHIGKPIDFDELLQKLVQYLK